MNIDLTDRESRVRLAKLLANLFDRWSLSRAERLGLLGLRPSSGALLSRYRNGTPLPNRRDVLERAGWLLAIHKALRLLFPRNPELRYSWVRRRNKDFADRSPLEVMTQEGMIGLFRVSRYLDFELDLFP